MSTSITVLAVVVVAFFAGVLSRFLYVYFRQRGERLVSCPETQQPAAVRVNALRAALSSLRGSSQVRLDACTRWPEREECGQECLSDIVSAPDGCMVHKRLVAWYADKNCALCGAEVDAKHWYSHEPALLDPAGRTLDWGQIKVLDLEQVLETHRPVCWNCHIIENVIRKHPDRIVFRP